MQCWCLSLFFVFFFYNETWSSFSCWGFLYFLNGTKIKISSADSLFEETVWTSVSNVLCFVMYLHFSSLVIRARYVFIKVKAQQESNKLSINGKYRIPQETYMPIFLKPSHKIRIFNVNIVYVCEYARVSVCILWFTSGFESFQKYPGSKTL